MSDCPFPGCGLADWHDGEHLPRLRLVQRFRYWNECLAQVYAAPHPGYCEVGQCRGVAVALYTDAEGKGLQVCVECEDDLLMQGATKLGTDELGVAA